MVYIVSYHVIGLKWDPNHPPYAFLYLRDMKDDPTHTFTFPLKPDEVLNILVSDKKICIGHKIDAEKRYFCSVPVTDPYVQCFSCQNKDFNRCFLLCDGTKPFGNCTHNKLAFEYCRTHPSSVYLTLIANRIKVGVSFNPLKRWVNQGSDKAIELWRTPNGIIARKIEQDLSKRFQISQTIKHNVKAKNIISSSTSSFQKFQQYIDRLLLYLDSSSYESISSDMQKEVVDLSPFYGKIPKLNSIPILVDITKSNQIVGTIIGTKGDFLVTKINNSFYLYNLKQIIGHLITFSSEPIVFRGQRSLTDFF